MPGNPLTDEHWASEVTQQITSLVGSVRDTTTNNAIKAVRAVVWGILIAILGLTAVVLLLVMLTRLLQALLALMVDWDRAVYLSYLVLGGIFIAAALLFFRRRQPRL